MSNTNRRGFVLGSLATAAAATLTNPLTISANEKAASAKDKKDNPYEFCAFIKPLQSLSYDELGEKMAELGYDGIEATVRRRGYITPDRAKDELPKLDEAMKKHGLIISIITSDILRADQKHANELLQTAASLGIKRYRMGFHKYDLRKPILPQVEALRPIFKDLAVLNREIGISAMYQNHSGANNFGATFWDLQSLIQDIPVDEIGSIFDIRHAVLEGGKAWPVYYNIMQSHIGAYSVKDFDWAGKKAIHVPLGKGRVEPGFFKMVKKTGYRGVFSVHVEYLGGKSVAKNLNALDTDLKTLKSWLKV